MLCADVDAAVFLCSGDEGLVNSLLSGDDDDDDSSVVLVVFLGEDLLDLLEAIFFNMAMAIRGVKQDDTTIDARQPSPWCSL